MWLSLHISEWKKDVFPVVLRRVVAQEANLEAQQYLAPPLVQRVPLPQVRHAGYFLRFEHAICPEMFWLQKLLNELPQCIFDI